MIPQNQWRREGENVDKRTARKLHSADFQRTLISLRKQYKSDKSIKESSTPEVDDNEHISVYIRKRPLLPHEYQKHEFDVISSVDSQEIVIHECKMYSDMRHKYVVSHHQRFSKCYDENTSTSTVYQDAVKDLVHHVMKGGKAVCMMYGQTGSGKTYTMSGFFQDLADDLFLSPVENVDFTFSVSAVEIAGSKCTDPLLNSSVLKLCEDSEGRVQLLHQTQVQVDSRQTLLDVLEHVKEIRATVGTAVNSQSSRSHLACYINLHHPSTTDLYGQLVLLDLAGSERNEDSFYHDAVRRKEAIEINKSHLALKECIRAISKQDNINSSYVPYRASALTRLLKDCLWHRDAKGSVIATVSPLSIDTEHTLQTLQAASHMLMETPHIRTDTTDVKENGEEEYVCLVRDWGVDQVRQWLGKVRRGRFRKYIGNLASGMDGRMLTRFTVARFTSVCGGNKEDATELYKAFKDEVARQNEKLKQQRERNLARKSK